MARILTSSASCVCHAVADLFLSPSSFTAAAGSPGATLQNTSALADALRDAGIATWNIEYRRVDNPGGGWPGTFTDVADAVDRVRFISREHPIDLSRVVTIGHSAGAHLALWAAARGRLAKDSQVYRATPLPLRAAVALGGPGDLRDFYGQAGGLCGSECGRTTDGR